MIAPIYGKAEARGKMRLRKSLSPTAGESDSSSNRIWSRVIRTFALAVIAGACVACGMGLAEKTVLKNDRDRIEITGRALLVGDQDEPTGYGLYSYVLFESPPNAETKPLYLAIISACLKEVPDLDGLKRKYPNTKTLNAMFIPVKVFPLEQPGYNSVTGDSIDSKVPKSEHTELKLTAEKILEQYNYDRAQTILHRLSKIYRNGGPYLVSSLDRVSSKSRISPSLFQDLSVVRLVSNQKDRTTMAYEWVLDFVERVSNPQSTGWDDATLATFSDKFRKEREPAFASYGVRAEQLDLKKYIVFPIPDNRTERTLLSPAWKTVVNDSVLDFVNALEDEQSLPAPRPVSLPSPSAPVRQRGEVCDGRCQVRW